MPQGELFGRPKKRERRGWTQLDRLRARFERLNKKVEDSPFVRERDIGARDDMLLKLI